MDRGILDDFSDGYTGDIALESGVVLSLYHGFLVDAKGPGVETKPSPVDDKFLETMKNAPTGELQLDSKTTVTLSHGRIMKVNIN